MNIVPLHKMPTRLEAQEIVRDLAEKGMVTLSRHARQRMIERNIDMLQIMTCLSKGTVTEGPIMVNKRGNAGGYEITVERLVAGIYLRVGVCLRFSQTAFVITAIKIN